MIEKKLILFQDAVFKPGVCRLQAGAHLVSQNCFCPQMSVCVFACVCVSGPKAMNNQWRDVA